MLVELRLEEPERQPGPPDLGHLHLAHQVREAADVVLVRVREEDGPHAVALAQVREVRQDEIDAEMLVSREGEAGVDDDDLLAQLEDGHVLAHLAEPAERDDPQWRHGLKYHLRAAKRVSMIHPSEGGREPPRLTYILRRASSPEARRSSSKELTLLRYEWLHGSGCWRVCSAWRRAPSSGPKQPLRPS